MLQELLAIFAIIFISQGVQTITGFAGTMLALPFLVLIMNIVDAKVLLMFVGFVWSIWILREEFSYINWQIVRFVCLIMPIGMLLGIWLTGTISDQLLLWIMSGVIILAALYNLLLAKYQKSNSAEKPVTWKGILIVLFAGVIHGLLIMGGPLLVLFVNEHYSSKESYRATLSLIWILLNLILLVSFMWQHVIKIEVLALSAYSMIPLIVSMIAGNWIYQKVDNSKFTTITNFTLLLAGIMTLFK
ncbi:sulfite exporter TauE/SafE family protein [Sporolactobacillus sp. KGMB 08714]|uniref:sulfite exporter TauE/SafE family protein n=1 Tax=Sporolactobacillus sp. KGMB 08714 TaxID=3064704 RepID=UPI002FBE6760